MKERSAHPNIYQENKTVTQFFKILVTTAGDEDNVSLILFVFPT